MSESLDSRNPSGPVRESGTLGSRGRTRAERPLELAAESSWHELADALRAIGGPRQRASSHVRCAAQRVAKSMRDAGDSASAIRRALTGLVMHLHGAAYAPNGPFDLSAQSVLLADVLQAAMGHGDSAEPLPVVDDR